MSSEPVRTPVDRFRGRSRGRIGQINDRGMVAFQCGRRMFESGMDWASQLDVSHASFMAHLTETERAAFLALTPATWQVMWWRGWNDAAQRDG